MMQIAEGTAEQSPVTPTTVTQTTDFPATDFLKVATDCYNRGFPITPVHPREKRGVLPRWNRHPARTLSEIHQLAKDFPNFNVGIVGRRGVGELCFLDIDSDGVEARIRGDLEKEGFAFPRTLTTATRPVSKPFKKHFIFRQTEYSVSKFKTKKNVKDLSVVDEEGKHPTLYDLKGVGGGCLVVAAGCVRDNGEVYTIIDDSLVIPIPDCLVDWLIEDITRFKSECMKEVKAKAKAKTPAKVTVPRDDVHLLINSRAKSFAALGCSRPVIEANLYDQVKNHVKDGRELIKTAKIQQRIHKAAYDPKLTFGKAPVFGQPLVISEKVPQTRHRHLVDVISGYPATLSSQELYERLRQDVWADADPKNGKHRTAVCRAMKQCGYIWGGRTWTTNINGDCHRGTTAYQ